MQLLQPKPQHGNQCQVWTRQVHLHLCLWLVLAIQLVLKTFLLSSLLNNSKKPLNRKANCISLVTIYIHLFPIHLDHLRGHLQWVQFQACHQHLLRPMKVSLLKQHQPWSRQIHTVWHFANFSRILSNIISFLNVFLQENSQNKILLLS